MHRRTMLGFVMSTAACAGNGVAMGSMNIETDGRGYLEFANFRMAPEERWTGPLYVLDFEVRALRPLPVPADIDCEARNSR